MTAFASRLKEVRKKHRMSMLELGRRIGIAKSTVAGYESGDREPSLGTVAAISRIFNVSSDYLLGISDTPHAPIGDPAASNPGAGFHWNGEPLTEDELELVLKLLKKAQTADTTFGKTLPANK